MKRVFDVEDRQEVLDFITSATKECDKIVALCLVGSGANGFNDEKSDLDFVIALDSDASMLEVMDYMKNRMSEKYETLYFSQSEAAHLQCYVLSNMLEIDIGFGCYEYAAARKASFKVLFDTSGVVEAKMIKSREWMDDKIYGDKKEKDIKTACNSVWARMMHAAVAIDRKCYFRAIGEMEQIRNIYIDLLGDRYCLESNRNHDIDKLPDEEKEALRSTFVTGEDSESLWQSLINLTNLVYKELDGCKVPVPKKMMFEYFESLNTYTRSM